MDKSLQAINFVFLVRIISGVDLTLKGSTVARRLTIMCVQLANDLP